MSRRTISTHDPLRFKPPPYIHTQRKEAPIMNRSNPLLWSTATTLGTHFDSITSSKILLVGSGGIGCELLKNLALCGFQHVEVIDLDTIDVSNLNRQFLFRSEHVGQSKCSVATKAALAMSPLNFGDDAGSKLNYKYYHGNVKSEQFDVKFVQQFQVVLNALDNVDARRHVNRLCLAADVPLVEAGTTGYLGQTTVICKQVTECYECQPKPTQKVYPICTIRSTPSQPVHCIVWAKELFALMFYHGEPKDKSMLYEDVQTVGESTYMDVVVTNRPSTDSAEISSKNTHLVLQDYVKNCIVALFATEIQKQIDMKKYKTAKHAPKPLENDVIENACINANTIAPSLVLPKSSYLTAPWTVEQCIAQIVVCIQNMYGTEQGCEMLRTGTVEFDKDDVISMQFVTAASNLRAHVFGIDLCSLHDAKGIAGNIIPAIATTNAIVAGLQILEVFKILQHQKSENRANTIAKQCKYTYCLRDKTRKGYYLQPTHLPPPSTTCFVCRKSSIKLIINTETCTLQELIDKVVKKGLGFNAPTIMIDSNTIYEEGQGADEAFLQNLPKILCNLPCAGIKVRHTLIYFQ